MGEKCPCPVISTSTSTLTKGMTIESVLKSAFAWLFELEENMNQICDQAWRGRTGRDGCDDGGTWSDPGYTYHA